MGTFTALNVLLPVYCGHHCIVGVGAGVGPVGAKVGVEVGCKLGSWVGTSGSSVGPAVGAVVGGGLGRGTGRIDGCGAGGIVGYSVAKENVPNCPLMLSFPAQTPPWHPSFTV
jgi:hypothetical protein